jgi:hypothetical protein
VTGLPRSVAYKSPQTSRSARAGFMSTVVCCIWSSANQIRNSRSLRYREREGSDLMHFSTEIASAQIWVMRSDSNSMGELAGLPGARVIVAVTASYSGQTKPR